MVCRNIFMDLTKTRTAAFLAELPRERIRLGKGDLFMRNGETAFEYLGPGDASFMLLKFSWD